MSTKIKKSILAFFAVISMVYFQQAAAHAYDMGKRFIPLQDRLRLGASGEATLERMGRMEGQLLMAIDLFGLQPGSVYSVWFADGRYDDMKAAGVDENHFKTNGSGNARYVTTTNEYEVDRWRYIRIYYHPDNNPRNMGGAVLAMEGDIKYGFTR